MNPPVTYNQYWLLNSISGWRAASFQELVTWRHGLARDVAGASPPFQSNVTARLKCPAALACGQCGVIYVLDAATDRVIQVEPSGKIQTIASFGGPGREPMRFRGPRGLAISLGRDRGVRYRQSPRPGLLAAALRPDRAMGPIGPDARRREAGIQVAVGRGRRSMWNHLRRRPRQRRGSRRSRAMGPGSPLWAPVCSKTRPSWPSVKQAHSPWSTARPRAQVVACSFSRPDAQLPYRLPGLAQPRSVAFDADLNLYVGNAMGVVFHYAPDAGELRRLYLRRRRRDGPERRGRRHGCRRRKVSWGSSRIRPPRHARSGRYRPTRRLWPRRLRHRQASTAVSKTVPGTV